MTKDKLKIYILEFLLLVILFLTLFEPNIVSKLTLSIILLICMLVIRFLLKKRQMISVSSKQVIILMIGFALIYLALFYILGIHFGFYSSSVKFSLWSIIRYIIPLTIIVISSEIIRFILLSQKVKSKGIITFIIMVLVDIIIYSGVYNIGELDDFLALLGFITFASISCNLLYNYISVRFGYKPIIAYRLLTILYMYFIPIVPDIYIFFRSIARMIYPYIIYIVLEYTYSKGNTVSSYNESKKRILSTTILVIIITLLAMLISCKFHYGILVVGSGSMTGTINKGDAVVFESAKNIKIHEGDVIIFKKDKLQIVHRVVDIKLVNGEYRYYTKGDANQKMDDEYVTKNNIIGVSRLKIKYIGYPTIWLKDMFDK